MTYCVVTAHLIGGVTWGYLPDEDAPEYPTLKAAIAASHDAVRELGMTLTFGPLGTSVEVSRQDERSIEITWQQDGYERGRRWEVVENA